MDTETHTQVPVPDESFLGPIDADAAVDERKAALAARNAGRMFRMPSAAAIADAIIRRAASEMHR